ncbi:hypothetical protein B296_00050182 [Ensete ventricosum]|uniref:Uncharacterized protein n=1 Tax=Ensete ventricosum TaxID=4639 RepID=A0A426XD38_ENSVE|nr:hypothetical protein B296_00050182 [Ensete ventricosum]
MLRTGQSVAFGLSHPLAVRGAADWSTRRIRPTMLPTAWWQGCRLARCACAALSSTNCRQGCCHATACPLSDVAIGRDEPQSKKEEGSIQSFRRSFAK